MCSARRRSRTSARWVSAASPVGAAVVGDVDDGTVVGLDDLADIEEHGAGRPGHRPVGAGADDMAAIVHLPSGPPGCWRSRDCRRVRCRPCNGRPRRRTRWRAERVRSRHRMASRTSWTSSPFASTSQSGTVAGDSAGASDRRDAIVSHGHRGASRTGAPSRRPSVVTDAGTDEPLPPVAERSGRLRPPPTGVNVTLAAEPPRPMSRSSWSSLRNDRRAVVTPNGSFSCLR